MALGADLSSRAAYPPTVRYRIAAGTARIGAVFVFTPEGIAQFRAGDMSLEDLVQYFRKFERMKVNHSGPKQTHAVNDTTLLVFCHTEAFDFQLDCLLSVHGITTDTNAVVMLRLSGKV